MPKTVTKWGTASGWTASGSHAMVSSAFPAASEAAIEILKSGGNAVDAAVAAAYALSVCEPSGSGLGGQTTMMICTPRSDAIILDGHSFAPAAVSLRTVSQKQQRWGYRACTIPSTPATLGTALERFGRLSMHKVLEPAIRLAEDGFPVTKLLRLHIRWCRSSLEMCPYASRVFLLKGRLPALGTDLRQVKLARTLKKLAANGTDDFYRGEIAKIIARDMRRNGGLLSRDDLANYNMPVEREAFTISYRGHRVISAPPPSGGLQLLLGLKILENLDVDPLNSDASEWYETMALIINAIFREREHLPLYHDRISPSLHRWLLSDERADEVAASIRLEYNLTPLMVEEEPGETTHLCVVDSEGTSVALTQSIQSLFGAKVANENLGFFYNNYLCTCPRFHHPYQLKSHAMPQSNVAPTFVFREDEVLVDNSPMLILGVAGSRRIISSILQVITNLIDRRMALPQAVDAPRVHAVLSSKALIERRLADTTLIDRLSQYFQQIQVKAARSHAMGAVHAISRDNNGHWIGVADRRREGKAGGY